MQITSNRCGIAHDDSSALRTEQNESLGEYNNLLSLAAVELEGDFAAIASPTLSKQETVTNLYNSIHGQSRPNTDPVLLWRSLFEFIPRLALMSFNLLYASIRFQVKELPTNSIYFRTWLEPRCVQSDVFLDDFYRNLPDDLLHENNVIVSFQPLDYSLLEKAKRINKKSNYIISVGLLDPSDIAALMLDYIFTALIKVKGCYRFKGSDVTAAINRSLLLDYLRLRSFLAYQEKFVSRKLLRFNLKAFVYVFENQSWEKACCYILKGQGPRLVGYQSSGFSPVFLNFFPTKLDAQIQPVPDVILTVGDLFTKYLLEHGNYSIPVKTFAALRFSYPNNGSHYTVTEPNPHLLGKILYAFPVQTSQYSTTIDYLIEAFANTSIQVHLKFHPMFQSDKIHLSKSIPSNFRIVDRVDMDCLSDTYDCVLFNDNSFGIESLFVGVRSYQFDPSGRFDDERFIYFNLWNTHLDYDELLLLRDQILSGNYKKSYDTSALVDYLNFMYRPYTGNTNSFLNLSKL